MASKSRLDRWGRTLKQITTRAAEQGPLSPGAQETQVRGVVEEVFTSEMLTRVWAAVSCAHDRKLAADLAEPIARGVLIGHLEARHRVLTLLLQGSVVSVRTGNQAESTAPPHRALDRHVRGLSDGSGGRCRICRRPGSGPRLRGGSAFPVQDAGGAARLAVDSGFAPFVVRQGTHGREPQRRLERPDRSEHSRLLSARAVRRDRPVPHALAGSFDEHGRRRPGNAR